MSLRPVNFTEDAARQIQDTVRDYLGRAQHSRVEVDRWALQEDASAASALYGTAAADYSSGATISLTPCDCNGVATGAANVTVTIPTSWGTVNLLSATVGGTDAVTVTCKIASGTLLEYAYAANGTPYLLGVPPTVVEFIRYDTSTTAFQLRVRWLIGTNVTTLSAWTDLADIEESKATSCVQPGS